MRSNPRFFIFFGLVAIGGVACTADDTSSGPRAVDARLRKSASCDDLLGSLRADAETRVRDEAARLVENYDLYATYGDVYYGGAGGGLGGAPPPPAAPTEGDAADGPSHFTDTNTQEAGVDEPDFVKTDGERIFLVHGDEVLVFDSWPAEETAQVGAVSIEGAPTSMFLAGEKLVVYSNVSFVDEGAGGGVGTVSPEGILAADAAWGIGYPYSYRSFTKITVLDVSTAAPSVLSERYVEGWLRDARRHATVVRTVLESPTWQPEWGGAHPYFWNESGLVPRSEYVAMVDAWLDERLAAIAAQDLDGFLPDELVREGDALVPVAPRCDGFYAPAPGQTSYGMAQVLTMDLDDLDTSASAFVLGYPGVVYSSADLLVLAQDTWSFTTFGAVAEHRTLVHAFALDGASTTYVGSGAVEGGIRNQFSLDEAEGILRVAVTEDVYPDVDPGTWAPPVSHNRVVTLRPEAGALVEVGRTPDMAVGERIFSVRYVGDRAYVVTFLQVDPLFVVDLADPAAPTILGEVEIPGFSTYMHPLGATHLLTIGEYVDPNTQTWAGMQLQIFDVTNPAAPAQVQSRIVGGYSAAQYDHKAFVFDAVTNLLAVPVDSYTGTFASTLELFEVSIESGFTPAGSVDHSDLFAECQTMVGPDYAYACDYTAGMRRGLFIDSYVYAVSYGGLSVHALADVGTPLATIDLPAPEFYSYYPYPLEGDVVF